MPHFSKNRARFASGPGIFWHHSRLRPIFPVPRAPLPLRFGYFAHDGVQLVRPELAFELVERCGPVAVAF